MKFYEKCLNFMIILGKNAKLQNFMFFMYLASLLYGPKGLPVSVVTRQKPGWVPNL